MLFERLSSLILCSLITSSAFGIVCSDYGDFKEFGGHYYSVTVKRLTFQKAKALAQKSGGYLAIPNSKAENDFITSLVKGGQYAWIGIHDPNFTANYCHEIGCVHDDSRFKTIKNEALIYKNWALHQPDNLVKAYDIVDGASKVAPLGEHWVALASPNGKWADFGNHFDEHNNPIQQYAVYEFESMPECYTPPTHVSDQLEGRKCNTKIYDTRIESVKSGQTFSCQQDQYGNEFCPTALAPCAQEWDYHDGYSEKRQEMKIVYTEPIKDLIEGQNVNISESATVCNDHYLSAFFNHVPSRGILQVLYINAGPSRQIGHNCGAGFILSNAYLDSGSGSFNVNIHSWGGGCHSKDFQASLYALPTSSAPLSLGEMVDLAKRQGVVREQKRGKRKILTMSSSSSGSYKFDVAFCPASGAQRPQVVIQAKTCPSSHPLKHWDGRCYRLECPSGFDMSQNRCHREVVDKEYYVYKCMGGANRYGNHYSPSQTIGSQEDPPKNNCKRKEYRCVASSDRPCAMVSGEWQCSPFPCFGGEDIESTDTQVGLNDADNSGWSESGECMGQMYIFDGKDNRCRSDDIFFGIAGGGCCQKDKVFLGMVACKDDEKKLAKLNKAERCHYVGEYCSKRIKLIGCVQKKKSYCCFNSKLARIINEQGRTQIGKEWGSAKSPECRGFTPEEFQKLDFSEIDLGEFFGEIQENFNVSFMKNQQNFIQNRVSEGLKNISLPSVPSPKQKD